MEPQPSVEELMEHVTGHLCEEHAEALEGLSDGEIERRVRFGLERARTHGIAEPEPATAFVTLMFLVGPGFDRQPAIAAALGAARGTAAERMRALFQRTCEQDWDEAAKLGNWDREQ